MSLSEMPACPNCLASAGVTICAPPRASQSCLSRQPPPTGALPACIIHIDGWIHYSGACIVCTSHRVVAGTMATSRQAQYPCISSNAPLNWYLVLLFVSLLSV